MHADWGPFWKPIDTLRENGYGFAEIHAARVAAVPVPGGSKEACIRLEILTIGRDVATVNLEYKTCGRDQVGRQSQTWVRFPDMGWKIVSAHVSSMEP